MSIYHACIYQHQHSTFNMLVYVQAMTHTQSSHVMTICTYKLITCQYIRTHILASKHVTLSQVVTLSNKSYNGPEASHKQSQPGPRDRPQTGHKHRPHAVIGSPRRSLPSLVARLGGPLRLVEEPVYHEKIHAFT